jgi:hypothetical protein
MANPPPNPLPKVLGSAPESFDGKGEKAEGFWSSLENYYYLNAEHFTDTNKKIASALTYFKQGTPAGDWARERQKAALAAHPADFGAWAVRNSLLIRSSGSYNDTKRVWSEGGRLEASVVGTNDDTGKDEDEDQGKEDDKSSNKERSKRGANCAGQGGRISQVDSLRDCPFIHWGIYT